jgi:hypothetical protein
MTNETDYTDQEIPRHDITLLRYEKDILRATHKGKRVVVKKYEDEISLVSFSVLCRLCF